MKVAMTIRFRFRLHLFQPHQADQMFDLHHLRPLKQVGPLLPEAQQLWTFKDKVSLITQCSYPTKLTDPFKPGNIHRHHYDAGRAST